ncbi:hypothetical protein DL765_001459 [Monosporascus sp. GIB2]|nr:hypothetical protein DL765_001459 [Monosporascus sp. GIB2]
MAHQTEPNHVASLMLSWHSLELVSCRKIQTLWADYGSICEVRARATTAAAAAEVRRLCRMDCGGNTNAAGEDNTFALILKLVAPPPGGPGDQGHGEENGDEGHLRKMLSYEVEQHFYDKLAPRLDPNRAAVARCLASTRDAAGKTHAGELFEGGRVIATLMTDLRRDFPVAAGERRRARLSPRQVHAALDWLAAFHGASRAWVREEESLGELVRPPLEEARRRRAGKRGAGAWLNGGYTYLATRRKEYAALAADAGSEWSAALCEPMGSSPDGPSVAERVAEFLAPRLGSGGDGGGSSRDRERDARVSYIHGDVKSENLFATAAGDRVAFFDFQYVGLGLGVCDLAKLFTCSVPLGLLLTGCDDARDVPEELRMNDGERRLLERYRGRLLELGNFGADGGGYDWELFVRHWEAALVDWLRFQMSWGAWGNTEWLEARVRSILRDEGFREWLLES